MKNICVVVCLVWSCSAGAYSNWLTLVGDPLDATIGIIEVDPTTKKVAGERSSILIRVSRPQERISTDGVPFRSYQASVEFDCTQRSARFLSVDFYEQPMWLGKPHKSLVYGPTQIRPLAFRFFEPNPLYKLMRAACRHVDEPRS